MRSQISMISAMLWSISSTPAPCSSRTERTTAANSGTSASGGPAAGSSSRTKRGSVASARATPSRRSSPCASERPARRRSAASPSAVEQRGGTLRGAPRARADTERSDLDVLAHRERAERVAVLKRPGETVPAAPVRRPARDLALAELDRALVGVVEAAEDVDERRLAGAVRPDQADDLATPQLEGDAAECLDPFVGTRMEEARRVSPGLLSDSFCCASVATSPRFSGRPWRRPCRPGVPCCSGS